MGESTQEDYESHLWTGGRRLVEKTKSTTKGWSSNKTADKLIDSAESQKAEDVSKGHMAREVGGQLIASVLLSINEVEFSIYRFLSSGVKNSERLSLPRPNLNRSLDREEKATGRERKFLAPLDRSLTGRGQSVDRFLNRLSRLAIALTS
ncbi:hypothetical protein CK203_049889 [Vitis vinifera]|uniref:Uncharacterized protein n=1 Tax=Vitis vinifera TaxID=29760 RepID=A0A438GVV1_VITVI|nr:hypothetical protein CK203_049889 [Vitis vinifera]